MASSFPAIEKERLRLLLFLFGLDKVRILNLGGTLPGIPIDETTQFGKRRIIPRPKGRQRAAFSGDVIPKAVLENRVGRARMPKTKYRKPKRGSGRTR
jgi:hypothetical protein